MSWKTPSGPRVPEARFDPGMDALLEAGVLLLASGAETYRVEDTLIHMGEALGFGKVEVFVTPTGVILSIPGHRMGLRRVVERHTRMDIIARVNDLSRSLPARGGSRAEILRSVEEISHIAPPFRKTVEVAAAAAACVGFAFLVGARPLEGAAAALAGALMSLVRRGLGFAFADRFLTVTVGGVLAGMIGAVGASFGLREAVLIPSSLILLVPGLQITNAVRDVLSGDVLSGSALALEAVVLALALAGGAGIGLGAARLVHL